MNIIDERENEMPCEDTISIHCKDTISRQAVDKIINDLFEYDNMPSPIWQGLRMIKSLPSVTPQPKKGHWIKIGAYQGKCSCCNNCVIDEDENFCDYCRHCGADMGGDE